MIEVSYVIPAFNEEERIEKTLKALVTLTGHNEIIVVDDGSTDDTAEIAKRYATKVISYRVNKGKGYALKEGWKEAKGEYIACLDADLEESAIEVTSLLEPLKNGEAEVAISIISPGKKAGMGMVKKRVQSLVYQKTGVKVEAPLSGQRVFHRKWLSVLLKRTYQGFGIETQMTIDLLQAGASYLEVRTNMKHREMGRTMKGFYHRMKQWLDIERQLRGVQS
ncbi:glycosyltransferase family 2 protein [Halalkalibacter krulwichiae]|uniref:Glucosyl-3-phosphoglycerate synthase n=1 Tax=Halalkalibacter krulwichiae TaxID=199441 RepID=A0A1X9MKZ0_9BACI|nr:glycosyltransferase family 2 protein [Halalkalibacter krulwichiae]ARK31382.1 Poly-beta-1,6-N-acetyl-D-glucosamine synthase [Halalkalibacter krulwichiae]